jgi:phospholipid/cholesterol/gamma-HCH transport system substrate-binding protein
MKAKNNIEIKVGIISFLSIILLIVAVIAVKGFRVSGDGVPLQIRFQNSGGVTEGSPVVVNGVKRGQVIDVKNDKNSVLITVSIDNIKDIKVDATAQISILEITGGKKVEILPGTNASSIDKSQIISGITLPDIPEVVANIGLMADDAKILLKRLDTISGSVSVLFQDEEFIASIKQSVFSAEKLIGDMQNVVSENKNSLKSSLVSIEKLTSELRTAVANNEPKVSKLLDSLQLVSNDARILLATTDKSFVKVDSLLSSVDGIIKDTKNGNGLVSKLLYDKQLSMKLDSAFDSISGFVKEVRKYGVNINIGGIGHRP